MVVLDKFADVIFSLGKEWLDNKILRESLIANLDNVLRCYIEDDEIFKAASSELIDVIITLSKCSEDRLKVYENAVLPVLKKYNIDELDSDILAANVTSCILNTIDSNKAILIKLNSNIEELSKLCMDVKELACSSNTPRLQTINDINQSLIDNRKLHNFDLSFFDYHNNGFDSAIKEFIDNDTNKLFIVKYRCPVEAYYCSLAVLNRLGYASKIRIISNREDYEELIPEEFKIYILNFDITGILFRKGLKSIAFYYNYEASEKGLSYDMKPCTRSVLRNNLSKANDDNFSNIQSILDESHGEFYAIFPKLVRIQYKRKFENSTEKDAMKMLMLLGGWSGDDVHLIDDKLLKENGYTVRKMDRVVKDSYLEYKSDPFLVGFHDLFGRGELHQVVSPDYVWSFLSDRLDDEDFDMLDEWINIIFSPDMQSSTFFKTNLLLNAIRISMMPKFMHNQKIKDSVFDLFSRNPKAFEYCHELLAELDGYRYLDATEHGIYDNDTRDNDYYRALSLLLCRRATALRVFERIFKLDVAGSSSYHVKNLMDVALLAWFDGSAISLNNVKNVFSKYDANDCWEISYRYLPDIMGASLGSCPSECKILPADEPTSRNFKDFYLFYISFCIDNCNSTERFKKMLEKDGFAVCEPIYGKQFIEKLKNFLDCNSDDSSRFRLELALRHALYGYVSDSLKEAYRPFRIELSSILDTIAYENRLYYVLWRFSLEPYELFRFYDDKLENMEDVKTETAEIIIKSGFSCSEFIGIVDVIKKEIDKNRQDNRFCNLGEFIYLCFKKKYSFDCIKELSTCPDGVIVGFVNEAYKNKDSIDVDQLMSFIQQKERPELFLRLLLLNIDGKSIQRLGFIDDKYIVSEFWNRYRVSAIDVEQGKMSEILNGMIVHVDKDDYVRMRNFLFTVFANADGIDISVLYAVLLRSTYVFNPKIIDNTCLTYLEKSLQTLAMNTDFVSSHLSGLLRIELFYSMERDVKKGYFFRYCFRRYPELYVELIESCTAEARKNPKDDNLFCELFDYMGCLGIYEDLGVFIGCSDRVINKDEILEWLCRFKELMNKQGRCKYYSHSAHLFCFSPRVDNNKVQICDKAAYILNSLIQEDTEINGSDNSAFGVFYMDMICSRGSYYVDYKSSAALAECYDIASRHYRSMNLDHVACCYEALSKRYKEESEDEFSGEVNNV